MKRILLLSFVMAQAPAVMAQYPTGHPSERPNIESRTDRPDLPVEIVSKRNKDNSISFWASKRRPGTYTIFLNFENLENCTEPRNIMIPVRYEGLIYTLRPKNSDRPIRYRFRYLPQQGVINPKQVDERFVYRLPFSLHRPDSVAVRTLQMRVSKDRMPADRRNEAVSHQFILQRGDTVFAIRRGTVVATSDRPGTNRLKDGEIGSTTSNWILVEHADGTLAYYCVLEPGSHQVNPGDDVYPGTALGCAGSLDGSRHEVRVRLYYKTLGKEDFESFKRLTANVYLNPVFATEEGHVRLVSGRSYRAVQTDEILQAEMSKRELKQLKKTGRRK